MSLIKKMLFGDRKKRFDIKLLLLIVLVGAITSLLFRHYSADAATMKTVEITLYTEDTCDPCQEVERALEEARKNSQTPIILKTVQLNTPEGEADRSVIKAIPTIILRINGEQTMSHTGTMSAQDIEKAINEAVSHTPTSN